MTGRDDPRPLFERFDGRDAADLIADYPLAWLLAADGSAPASLVPLLALADAQGDPVALTGHLACRNPLVAALRRAPAATILFTGPQGYVSPAMVTEPNWAPTWNYALLRVRATVAFEPERGEAAIDELLEHMERGAPTGWTPAALGSRRAGMMKAIIAFRADIVALSGRFKLGQDETVARLREIIAAHPDQALVRWMRRFNRERLQPANLDRSP